MKDDFGQGVAVLLGEVALIGIDGIISKYNFKCSLFSRMLNNVIKVLNINVVKSKCHQLKTIKTQV